LGRASAGGRGGLNKSWNGYGNSIAAIECFDDSASVKRLSFGKDAQVNYEITPEGLLCRADFGEAGIRFSVLIKLEGERISFSLVPGSLEEGLNGSTYTIKSLSFLPYLGASLNSIDGYLFIPDGSGALIASRRRATTAPPMPRAFTAGTWALPPQRASPRIT
jgi:hypothetical protein